MARRSSSGPWTASIACASLGPDAARGLEQLEQRTLVVVGEPEQGQRVLAHHHGGRERGRLADPQPGEAARRAHHLDPDTSDLDDGRVDEDGGDLAGHERDHQAPFPAARASGRHRSVPAAAPRQMWHIASASASAASAGFGRSSSRSSRVTIAVTCALSARPLPVTAALTSLGVCSATGRSAPSRRRRWRARTPGPCPSRCGRCAGRRPARRRRASGWCSSSQASSRLLDGQQSVSRGRRRTACARRRRRPPSTVGTAIPRRRRARTG